MSEKYEYLRQYIGNNVPEINWFEPLTEDEVLAAEARLGFQFPSQLRDFYLTVGYGIFYNNHDFSVKQNVYSNRLIDPDSIAEIIILGEESGQITWEAEFKPGDLPFFEIADRNDFLVLKPHSENPNAVYDMFGRFVEESFEKFIYRLYYESPTFYLNILCPDEE